MFQSTPCAPNPLSTLLAATQPVSSLHHQNTTGRERFQPTSRSRNTKTIGPQAQNWNHEFHTTFPVNRSVEHRAISVHHVQQAHQVYQAQQQNHTPLQHTTTLQHRPRLLQHHPQTLNFTQPQYIYHPPPEQQTDYTAHFEAAASQDLINQGQKADSLKDIEDQFARAWEKPDLNSPIEANQTWVDQFMNPLSEANTSDEHRFSTLRYTFEERNHFLENQTDQNPLEYGIWLMQSGSGSLTDAALSLEAALQRIESLGLNDKQIAEAWRYLGQCQAENEKEDAAIAALQESVKLDPLNESALFSLAISYTNEGADAVAAETLFKWLQIRYPQYAQRTGPANEKLTASEVIDMFLQAARTSGSGQEIDPNVQEALGALYYMEGNYDRSVDCFEAALTVKPNDPILWNRLGATMANSSRTEEAVSSYSRALELKPTFTRARYNLGVGCLNIGCFREAAEHFLSGLSTHGGAETKISTVMWDTLRRALICMDRPDLLTAAAERRVEAFRDDFEF